MRNVRGALGASVLLALAVAPSAAQAADPCPNAALRTGAQAALPDCRAWEQVSPTVKNGVDVVNTSAIASVDGGNHVYFNASGAFAGTEAVVYDTAYAAARGADWSTRGLDPVTTPSGFYTKVTLGLSEDGTKAIVSSTKAFTPDATPNGSNLYVRDLTQPDAYKLLVTTASQQLHRQMTTIGGQGQYLGATADLSSVAFASSVPLLPGVPEAEYQYSLYLLHDGKLTLASVDEDGAPILLSPGTPNTPPRTERRLSEDGRRVWFKAPGDVVYSHVAGESRSTLVTRSARPGAKLGAVEAFASPNGRTIVYRSTDPDGVESSEVRRWSADRPTAIDTLAKATTLEGASPDGRTAWFTFDQPLTPDAGAETTPRLYQVDADTRTVRLVGTLGQPEASGLLARRFSPDGRTIAFVAASAVTGADTQKPQCRDSSSGSPNGECQQVFTWDADTPDRPVQCVSCGPAGTVQQGPPATFGRSDTGFDGRISRNVLDDGTVVFDSPNRLVPADTNTTIDVYEWRPGSGLALLSGGTAAVPANFGDISENGRDVFFATADRLVAQDVDTQADLYSARVDGGIASQRIAPAAAGDGCAGESCRPGTGTAQPARPLQGSASFEPPAPGVTPRLVVTLPSRRATRAGARRGRLVVTARVNVKGTVSAALTGRPGNRTVGKASRTLSKAGTTRLTLRLSKAARRELRRTGRLPVRLTVAFSETTTRYRKTLTLTTGRAGSDRKGGAR